MTGFEQKPARRLFAGLLLIELIAMVVFIALAGDIRVFPGSDPSRLLYARLGFIFAAFVAVTLMPLVVLLRMESGTRWDASAWMGLAFLTAYMAINTTVYTTQVVAVPRLFHNHPELAQALWFGDPGRLGFSIDLFGYTMYGFGAMMLGLPLTRDDNRRRINGFLLLLSGLLSVMCYFTYALGFDSAASVLTAISGALLLPLALNAMRA